MRYVTAKPPSTYVPSRERWAFRKLLDEIAACDEKNGTQTPKTTFSAIISAAECLGVPPAELTNDPDDEDAVS